MAIKAQLDMDSATVRSALQACIGRIMAMTRAEIRQLVEKYRGKRYHSFKVPVEMYEILQVLKKRKDVPVSWIVVAAVLLYRRGECRGGGSTEVPPHLIHEPIIVYRCKACGSILYIYRAGTPAALPSWSDVARMYGGRCPYCGHVLEKPGLDDIVVKPRWEMLRLAEKKIMGKQGRTLLAEIGA